MIKKAVLSNGTEMWFGQGKFDNHCIYVDIPGFDGIVYPKDEHMFEHMKSMAEWKMNGGPYKTYANFLRIYENTGKELEQSVIDLIKEISKEYVHSDEAELIFSYLYLGMIAEENKVRAPLGKRIKHLGVKQVLIENMDPEEAAFCSIGKDYKFLVKECEKRGI